MMTIDAERSFPEIPVNNAYETIIVLVSTKYLTDLLLYYYLTVSKPKDHGTYLIRQICVNDII
jgi:hypothetical protein